MKSLKLYDDETLERFVLGQMPDEELDVFLANLTLYPELQADIDATRERIKAIRGLQPKSPARVNPSWAIALLLLLSAGILVYFWLGKDVNAPTNLVPNEPKNQPLEQTPAPQQPIASVNPDSGKQNNTPAKPMASAFQPNPQLDLQITSGVRSEGYTFQISTPILDQTLQAGQTSFTLAGKLNRRGDSAEHKFRVLIFDNQPASVEAMRFKAAFDLPLNPGPGNAPQTFQIQHNTSLKAGLYYYIIEDEQGDWYYVGRFKTNG